MPKTLTATKHFHLALTLRRRFALLAPGAPVPTVAALMKRYGVSQATLERALNQLRKERLIWRPPGQKRLVVAEAHDPASRRIALLRPEYPAPTFDALCRMVVDAGRRRNWSFDLVTYRTLNAIDLARTVNENDGAILLPDSMPFPEHLARALRHPQRPVVVIQDPPEGLPADSVQIDDEAVGHIAVQHLAELGHRRILAFLSEPPTPSGRARLDGWRRAMQALGEGKLDPLVIDAGVRPYESSLARAYDAFTRWLDGPHPAFTAVFCAAWTGAVSALRALREHGIRVPADVSVIAHGGEDQFAPFLNPPLTTVETDMNLYGEEVVDMLGRQIERPGGEPRHLRLPCTLVRRGSTGPAPAKPR